MAKRTKGPVGITIQSHLQVQAKVKSTQLPFHILFLGDLNPQGPADGPGSLIVEEVNKESFSQLMQRLAPRLSIDVPDLIGRGTRAVEVNLQFHDLKAFRPESISAQVPALSRLRKVRMLVEKVRKGELPLADFKTHAEAAGLDPDLAQRFQEVLAAPDVSTQPLPPATPEIQRSASQEEGKLGSLLRMVDLTPGGVAGKKPDSMNAFLTAITGNGAGSGVSTSAQGVAGVEGRVATMLTAELDQMLSDQVNAILHDPRFQRLEASWRELKFLVDRIDFRKNIRFSVLATHKEHLNAALHNQLLNPSDETRKQFEEAPASVVITDVEFGISPREVDHLRDIAETMASAQVPFVAAVGPSFFGRKGPSDIAELAVLWQHFERPEYVAWNSLRSRDISAYVALALPGFLLRFPYGPDNPVKEFQFVESPGSTTLRGGPIDPTLFLWGSPAVAVAITMARSFAESGWPTHFTGPQSGGRVDDLPLWFPSSSGTQVRIPLDVNIPEDKQVELSEMGFTVLSCRPNDDSVCVAFAPTIHLPGKYDNEEANEDARTHATLACQLMTSRILQHLLRFERDLPPHLSTSAVKGKVVEVLGDLLKATEARLPYKGIEVEITERAGPTNRIPLKIRVTTPPEILGREVSIVMGYELTLK